MRILLLRHGQAGGRMDDPELTEAGRARALAVGHHLRTLCGLEGARVRTSPRVRAKQTAELALRGWGGEATPEICGWLADERVGDVLAHLEEQEGDRAVLLVGHLPLLGVVARVLAGDAGIRPPQPGTLLVLDGEPEPGGCRLAERFGG